MNQREKHRLTSIHTFASISNHRRGRQSGLTLIEVMTAIVLFALISAILYSFLFMGISMYKRVAAEAQLRSQVNVFYSKVLEYIDQSVYAFPGQQKNEIIVIKKPDISSDSYEDQRYIEYYSIKLDPVANQVSMVPVVGAGINDRRFDEMRQFTIDATQFDLDPKSTLTVKKTSSGQLISVDLTFSASSQMTSDNQSPTIQMKSEIPVYAEK